MALHNSPKHTLVQGTYNGDDGVIAPAVQRGSHQLRPKKPLHGIAWPCSEARGAAHEHFLDAADRDQQLGFSRRLSADVKGSATLQPSEKGRRPTVTGTRVCTRFQAETEGAARDPMPR